MECERDTFERIAQARSQYDRAVTISQKAQADQSMTLATRGLLAVAENYPQLKASDNFLKLQQRITELESQIADRREFYNDSVNTYNVRMQQAPDMIVAGWMHLQPRQMFKVEEADKANLAMVFSTGTH
jgi:LemA protein